ncbi:MAG: iron ABC transporter permease [Actinomycetaceae bacterium]|nr:iron ABC transporter permease [Actinomycetaceae bacterium]
MPASKFRRHFTDSAVVWLGWFLGIGVPVVFLAVFFLLPTSHLIARGFVSDSGSLDFTGLSEVLSRSRTWRIIWQTLWMALVATLVCLVLALPGAWTLYRTRFPGRALLRGVVAVPFVLPSVVVGVAFRSVLGPNGPLEWLGLDGTATAIILGMVFFNFSLAVRTVGNLWVRLDPRTEQAAAALGAGPWRRFFTVTLPRLLPAFAAAGAMVFLFCTTAFGLVLILGGSRTGTVETEIYFLTTGLLDLRSAAVLSIVQLVVIAFSLWLGARARRWGASTQKLRTDVSAHPLSRADLPAFFLTVTVILGLIVFPLTHLLWRSLHRSGAFTFANYSDLARSDAARVLRGSVLESAWHSIEVGLVATLVALVVALGISVVTTRRLRGVWGRRALAGLDALFMLPLGVSAVTVGFGFLITLNRPPVDLRGSWWLIPLAQAMVAIPLVVRVVTPVLASIDPRQREVAAVLGAGPARVLWSVEGPYILRSLAVGGAFAFAMSLGEFGATAFLVRPDSTTLPVAIYRLLSLPQAQAQGMALAGSALLALLSGGVMALVEGLSDRRASTGGGR